jgi:hypothetical protein
MCKAVQQDLYLFKGWRNISRDEKIRYDKGMSMKLIEKERN